MVKIKSKFKRKYFSIWRKVSFYRDKDTADKDFIRRTGIPIEGSKLTRENEFFVRLGEGMAWQEAENRIVGGFSNEKSLQLNAEYQKTYKERIHSIYRRVRNFN